MSKNHRGSGIRNLPLHGRGECPVCKRTGVKILYEQTVDGQTVKVCKICNAKLKHEAKKAAAAAAATASTATAEAAAE
ncbi:MAG: hypothetical protein K2M50_08710 [Treponemataceae bacterium]|nr:hypothetical protein [Treponema sp.]MDE6245721.1 hypothetical protein [Treponemataceae bacterium]MDE7383154.1 hypothetical protein [Treponemataceae bacterium]